jgi:hypothetical protein
MQRDAVPPACSGGYATANITPKGVNDANHMLSAAARVWQDVGADLRTAKVSAADAADGVLVPKEELEKVGKWLTHVVTKFGASASVADGPDRDKALRPIAEEVIKAFTAAIGTLLALRKGAGPCLLSELQDVGGGLAAAVDILGTAVSTPGGDAVSVCAGKVLDRNVHFKKMSTQNRAAVRRRILRTLTQLRDAGRELRETISASNGAGDEDDEAPNKFDDFDDLDDEELEPEERAVLEAIVAVIDALEAVLKEVSQNCVPGGAAALIDLEAAVVYAVSCADSIDSMAASACGGLEVEPLRKDIKTLRATAAGFSCICATLSREVEQALERLVTAVDLAAAAA